MANGLWWNAIQVQAALCGARVAPRPGREDASSALANLYRCGDGRWLMLNVLAEDRDWPALLRALGRPDLGADPRFATIPARRASVRALIGVLEEIFASRPLAEWRAALDAEGLTFGFVGTVDDARTDAQMVASGALVPIDDARAGAALTVSSPLWVEGEAKVPPRYAPELGEHSAAILAEVGYSEAEIDRMIADGVVVQDKPGVG
jgi:formyl-CoA transferase